MLISPRHIVQLVIIGLGSFSVVAIVETAVSTGLFLSIDYTSKEIKHSILSNNDIV